ncbi:hypothetical protein FRC11_008849, partial [Ceratobasidium sp. 423]
MDAIQFHQLRSNNKNAEYRHWRHDSYGFRFESFALQPEIDLLVLAEGVINQAETTGESEKRYRLHFRTISDNDPHPLAASPVLDLGVHLHFPSDLAEMSLLNPSVCGQMVLLQSDMNQPKLTFRDVIVVCDWIKGVEILRIPVPTGCRSYPVFISEEYLIVTHTPETQAPSQPQGLTITQLGCIVVYKLRSVSPEALHVATFELPKLSDPHKLHRVTAHSGSPPLAWTPYWLNNYKYTPRIYDTTRRNQLLCLGITSVHKFKDAWHTTHIFASIPVRIFLDYLINADDPSATLASNPTLVPWSEWGSRVPLNYPCVSTPATLLSMSGLRHSIRNYCYFADDSRATVFHDTLALFDSDPQRLKLARAEGREGAIDASYPYDQPAATLLDVHEEEIDSEPVNPSPLYTKMSIILDIDIAMKLEYVSSLIDDEH